MTETMDAPTRARAGYPAAVARRVAAIVSPSARVIGVDVARGLAVLGMFAAHVGVTGAFDWVQPSSWLAVVNGRSAILFAVLAGVSIAILSGRSRNLDGVELAQARLRIFTRAAIIFALGGLLEYLGTNIAIILPVYAALFVLSLPFLRLRSRALFLAAALTGVLMPIVIYQPSEPFGSDDYYLGGGAIVDLLITGTYPGFTWMAFIFLGIGIGRLRLDNLRVQLTMFGAGAALAAVAYTAGSLGALALGDNGSDTEGSSSSSSSLGVDWETKPGSDVDLDGTACDVYDDGTFYCFPEGGSTKDPSIPKDEPSGEAALFPDHSPLVTAEPHSDSPFEVVGSGGFALAVIALCLLATRRRGIRALLLPLASVGAMALTAYSAHVVVVFALSDVAFTQEDNGLFIVFAVAALVVCTAWTLLIGRGPLEQVLSRVATATAQTAPSAAGRLGTENPHKENTTT